MTRENDLLWLMRKHGLTAVGVNFHSNGGATAWSSRARDRGWVSLFPPGVGVFYGRTVDSAVAKVAQFDRACMEGGI